MKGPEKPKIKQSASGGDKGTGTQTDGPRVPTRKENNPDNNPGPCAEKRNIRSKI